MAKELSRDDVMILSDQFDKSSVKGGLKPVMIVVGSTFEDSRWGMTKENDLKEVAAFKVSFVLDAFFARQNICKGRCQRGIQFSNKRRAL